jgi:hypothetical protein
MTSLEPEPSSEPIFTQHGNDDDDDDADYQPRFFLPTCSLLSDGVMLGMICTCFFFSLSFFFNGDDNFFEYVIHRDLFSDMSRVFLQVVFFFTQCLLIRQASNTNHDLSLISIFERMFLSQFVARIVFAMVFFLTFLPPFF